MASVLVFFSQSNIKGNWRSTSIGSRTYWSVIRATVAGACIAKGTGWLLYTSFTLAALPITNDNGATAYISAFSPA